MSNTEIYLIRHGRTDYNAQYRLQGRSDIPLNETGRLQAGAAAEQLKALGISFDTVFSSPLCRAKETAALVSGWPPSRIAEDPRLIEISFGPWEGQDFRTLGPHCAAFFDAPHLYTPPHGGESLDALLRRTGQFLDFLREAPCGQRVLVASHGAALNAIYVQVQNLSLRDFWAHRFGNCGIVQLSLSNGRFSVAREFPPPSV